MRRVYTGLLWLLLPFVLLRLVVRGVRNRGYWQRWGERFGFVAPAPRATLWLHAVSVGETRAAAPLVKALRQAYPDLQLWITTTTATGSAQVRALFGDTVTHSYLPYDLPGAVQRFLRRARPRALIVMETELWPNLFYYCARAGVPIAIANLRLSARSYARYTRFASLTRATLAHVRLFAAQAGADAERIRALGAPRERVHLTGNIKYDLMLPDDLPARAQALRASLGRRPTWIAASTHAGEDEIVLRAQAELSREWPDLLLILVPRHPERFAQVAKLAAQDFAICRRSSGPLPDARTQVWVGDTMGELPLLLAISQVAFVGGSLVPVGGHNILEPAALGIPSVFGPHMFNFADIAAAALVAGAATQVQAGAELAPAVARYLRQSDCRAAAGEAATRWIAANRGALRKTVALIDNAIRAYP